MADSQSESQAFRSVAVASPLGDDVLLFHSMSTTEQMGRPFQFDLDLLSADPHLRYEGILGQAMTVRLDLTDGKTRYFNGYVSRFDEVGQHDKYASYHVTLRPWLWFLTRTSDYRIFQEQTVPDIIKEVFRAHGFTDFEEKLSETYKTWDYCVQYHETDFNFVSRLMEHEGIYYFFRHEDGKHTMVLSDGIGSHSAVSGYENLQFFPPEGVNRRDQDHIYSWNASHDVQPGVYKQTDYDFEHPGADLHTVSKIKQPYSNSEFELYDYPGSYNKPDEGERYARTRIEERDTQHAIYTGEGTARVLHAGCLFKLEQHPREDYNQEYLITSITHNVVTSEYTSGTAARGSDIYTCNFNAVLSKTAFRSARLTAKPSVQGPQTAIVTGPSGEEIYTDEFGRVKVQFHWDRYGEYNENSSCWIRVAHVWSGSQWGGIHIPRIGQEVIVEFLNGDPDRPIITGAVYNNDNMPPYDLPANQTQSGIKSRSTKEATGNNFNELRFEDKKGSEEVYLHGEKNLKIDVKSSVTETAGSSITNSAGGSISQNAGKDINRTADANITDKAGVNITTESGKNMNLKAGGAYVLFTNLGIQLKAMNFMADLIESSAKAAAEAVIKGAGAGAKSTAAALHTGGEDAGAAAFVDSASLAGQSGLAALSPAIEQGAAGLLAMQAGAENVGDKISEQAAATDQKAEALNAAIESGASSEVIGAAFMAFADAALDTYSDAKKMIEGLFPQIPNIELWAMKDVNAHALWSMSLSTKTRDININAQNRDINIAAKKNVKIEAKKENIEIKASKKDIQITGKEKVNIKSEDKDVIIEAASKKVRIKSAKQIFLQCGSATISMSSSGNIVIKGAKININGSGPVTVKGTPIKLN